MSYIKGEKSPMTEQPHTEDKVKHEETEDMDGKKSWVEDIEVAGRDAVGRVQDLIQEGNVRRVIIMTEEDRVLLEIPLTAGVAIGVGTLWFSAPLAAVGAVVAFLAKIKIRVVRVEDDDSGEA
jgi:uncharacterized membrane protein YphA (DoxX/SURF4 family)